MKNPMEPLAILIAKNMTHTDREAIEGGFLQPSSVALIYKHCTPAVRNTVKWPDHLINLLVATDMAVHSMMQQARDISGSIDETYSWLFAHELRHIELARRINAAAKET
jgi:non-ribosomal peptide synthetase component F